MSIERVLKERRERNSIQLPDFKAIEMAVKEAIIAVHPDIDQSSRLWPMPAIDALSTYRTLRSLAHARANDLGEVKEFEPIAFAANSARDLLRQELGDLNYNGEKLSKTKDGQQKIAEIIEAIDTTIAEGMKQEVSQRTAGDR